MSYFWFLIAVGFMIAWLSARDSLNKNTQKNSTDTDSYARGFKDGYRAFADKVAALLGADDLPRDELQRLVDGGHPNDAVSQLPPPAVTMDVPVAVPQPAPRVVTEEELANEKERSTLRNLNILLYVGSFLIVAAAALFVTLVMPAAVKLTSLILVTIAFYASGLVLYGTSLRLRPAAIAFTGTGLAILPFVGFALTSLGGLSAEVAWCMTSFVGLLAYGVAAVRLRSEFVSYLMMAFVVSLALSAVSTLGLSMIWYFIALIGVSLVCNSIHILYPMLLPRVFSKPIEQTGHIVVPVALAASLFTVQHMSIFMYEVLYAAATAHYLVVWLQKRTVLYETFVRVIGHVTLLIVAFDVSGIAMGVNAGSYQAFGIWWLGAAILQAAYSLIRVRGECKNSVDTERAWIAAMIGVIGIGMLFWLRETNYTAQLSSISLIVAGMISAGAMMRFRQVGWAYVGLVVSVALPFVIGRGVISPDIPYEVLAGVFTVMAVCLLAGLDWVRSAGRSVAVHSMLAISAVTYILFVAFCGLMAFDGVTIGWTMALCAALFVSLSYLLKSAAVEVVGALFAAVSVVALVSESSVEPQWRVVVIAVVSSILIAAAACVHHFNRERSRRDGLAMVAALLFASLAFVFVAGAQDVVVRTAVILLVVASVAAMGLRLMIRFAATSSAPVQISQCVYAGYPLLALLLSWQVGDGWVPLVLMVYTGLLWGASYVEKQPVALVIGNVLLTLGVTSAWSWLAFDYQWRTFGVTWISAAIFYAIYWLMVDKRDEWRQRVSLISVWVVLGLATLSGIWSGDVSWLMAGAGSLLAIAATLAIEGYRRGKQRSIEIAIYLATFSLQRMTEVLLPETNMVVYGHWWALVIALVALWRKDDKQKQRLVVALAFVTGSTGLYALAGTAGYSLVFLIEHVIILTLGAVLRKQWMMWWGIISVVVAVMYFLRDFTFLALLFLGFLLILFVVWRLTKMGKKQSPAE